MKVIYQNDSIPRADNAPIKPTHITVGNVYEVVEEIEEFFVIVNDKDKKSRYLKSRFLIA